MMTSNRGTSSRSISSLHDQGEQEVERPLVDLEVQFESPHAGSRSPRGRSLERVVRQQQSGESVIAPSRMLKKAPWNRTMRAMTSSIP